MTDYCLVRLLMLWSCPSCSAGGGEFHVRLVSLIGHVLHYTQWLIIWNLLAKFVQSYNSIYASVWRIRLVIIEGYPSIFASQNLFFGDTMCHASHFITRVDSRFAPSQWETVLHWNYDSHWLGSSLESALITSHKRSHRWAGGFAESIDSRCMHVHIAEWTISFVTICSPVSAFPLLWTDL